ncbi:fumarylacetoacetate hydrolase family protein [Paenibacillus rhizovicinus]|uniref:Fumarylacetoacetate hydrolase family protein n=1 Tax=Paenibacillus rhizovicinus TaxID=2704463 RepID=A0A6C0P4P0_9BACL|nr:fumarylacetoacetate hydrolase family protein [Paenibacillus rhizovicinus]
MCGDEIGDMRSGRNHFRRRRTGGRRVSDLLLGHEGFNSRWRSGTTRANPGRSAGRFARHRHDRQGRQESRCAELCIRLHGNQRREHPRCVNGELRQDASTALMLFDVPTLIEAVSAYIPLEPGDVLSTGTPAGVGKFRNPPVYLLPGDRVVVEVEGIGQLENGVAAGW